MNNEIKKIKIVDAEGNQEEVEILVAFKIDTTGKEYIIYTKNEKDENDNITVYASCYEEVDGKKQLTGINSDEEWTKIKEVIKQLAKED